MATTGSNTVQFALGKEADLRPIFSYYTMPESWQKDGDKTLREGIEHAFTFTMLRDQFYGGWAHCWKNADDGKYYVKLTSPNPNDDVTDYQKLIPVYVKAVQKAQKLVAKGLEGVTDPAVKAGLSFLPPFGLSMLRTRGVLLLHYPPDEPIVYLNYLHARTVKRWESLLIANGCSGEDTTLLQSIVDVFPVAADGGSAGGDAVDALCQPMAEPLADYAYSLLTMLLRPKSNVKAKVTQPMLALGGAVRDWLFNNKSLLAQISEQIGPVKKPQDLKTLSQFNLKLQKTGPVTPVLMMDHPCKYYRGYNERTAATQVRTDLIGSRWYVQMSQNPAADPKQVLDEATAFWKSKDQKATFDRIVQDQFIEFRNCVSGTEA